MQHVLNTIMVAEACHIVACSQHLCSQIPQKEPGIWLINTTTTSHQAQLWVRPVLHIWLHSGRVRCMTLNEIITRLKWTPPHPQTRDPLLLILWCRDATLRLGAGGMRHCCLAARRPEASFTSLSHINVEQETVLKLTVPFLELSSVFSGHCWPLSLQSAPSPNSTQPSCSVDAVTGCGKEGN